MSCYEYYQVEIKYKKGNINKEFYITNTKDDIVVKNKDEENESSLYLNTINKGKLNIALLDIDEIWIEYIEEGYTEDRYLFWTN